MNRDCAFPGDHEHDHRMCQDAVAGHALAPVDPVATVDRLGAVWSDDIDAYAAGQLDAAAVRCALCGHAPCDCPPFGTPERLAMIADAEQARLVAGRPPLALEADAEQARLIHEVYEELDRDGTLALFREAYSADPAGDGCDPEAHR